MDCMTKSEDFEASTKSRGEEVKALGAAMVAIKEMASRGTDVSFLQTKKSYSALVSGADLANFEAVRFVRDLAKRQHSPELAQLASRMATVLRLSEGSGGPFSKVKGLISDMIDKLEKEQADAADLKAWCDKELAESNAKKIDTTSDNERLTTKIDSATAHSSKLKEEVARLQKELAELAANQAEMDKLRSDEQALYNANKPELEMGLKGTKLALKILNDYFAKSGKAHSASEGAGSGIIAMIEVVESDLSKSLAEIQASEDIAAATYDRETKENNIAKLMKEQDVKYKTKEYTGLDKSLTELSADREGVQAELEAVTEYLQSLDKKCTYKVESHAERRSRQEAEVAGLKEALSILENEVALIQTSPHMLRGVNRHQ